MQNFIKDSIPIFALIATFINVILTYRLNIQAKYRDRDLNKEYELNTVLSNLLDVWYYLNRYRTIQEYIPSTEKQFEGIFPKEFTALIVYATLKQSDDSCFDALEESIQNLKKYDPITYFKHIDTGTRAKSMCSFTTFLSHTHQNSLHATRDIMLQESIKDVKESIELIAASINPKMLRQANKALNDIYTDHETIERIEVSLQQFKDQFLPMFQLLINQVPSEHRAELFANPDFLKTLETLMTNPEEAGTAFNQLISEMTRLSRLQQNSTETM